MRLPDPRTYPGPVLYIPKAVTNTLMQPYATPILEPPEYETTVLEKVGDRWWNRQSSRWAISQEDYDTLRRAYDVLTALGLSRDWLEDEYWVDRAHHNLALVLCRVEGV